MNKASKSVALSMISLASVLVIIIYLSSGASINCSIMLNSSCSNTKILFLENESGGFNNAHAQNISIGNYSYVVCCNAIADTISADCEDATMLLLSDVTNAHVQAPFHSSYTVKSCISAATGTVGCSYRNDSCGVEEECIVSMASSTGDNSTNAHVGNCSYYSLQVCCSINSPPEVSVGPVITPSRPRSADNLTCNFTITDVDASDSLFANYTWYNSTDAVVFGQVSVTNGTAKTITLGSGNTSYGENWNCSIIPYDETQYGTEKSDNVTINTPPSKVNLSYPEDNDTTFINRTPRFNWTNATDPDGDTLTYNLQISQYPDMDPLFDEIRDITSNFYEYPTELDFTTYYWRVQANDSLENGSWSDTWNFTVVKYIAIALVTDSISFPMMQINTEDDTSDNNPEPFTIQNDGNYEANISVNASRLWQSSLGILDTDYFQYKANYSTEGDSFDYAKSLTNWQNMSATLTSFISTLNHTDSNDLVGVDLRILVPGDEPPGAKSTNVTFVAEEAP